MFVAMASVIDDKVERSVLAHHIRQKIRIDLTALQDGDALAQIHILLLDIDADDAPFGKEIAPDLKRFPAPVGILITADTDFQQLDRPVAEPFEQPEIFRHIVVIAELVGSMDDRKPRQRIGHYACLFVFCSVCWDKLSGTRRIVSAGA